jgi:secreted Zn-dependent insulinase-like peptidase
LTTGWNEQGDDALTVTSSREDTRAYGWAVLPSNGLRALLISDPDATVAAAALDVQALN